MNAELSTPAPGDRHWLWLEAGAAGLSASIAFPLVIPVVSDEPLFDFLPRELGIFAAAFLLFRVVTANTSRGRRVALSWVAGLVHFSVLLYWLDIAMVRYGGMPQWQALPALALLVAFCATFWAVLPLIVDLLRRLPRLDSALGFSIAVVFLEWLRGVLFTGFPWGLWGYTQTRNRPLLELASLSGVYGVSWVIAATGALSARAWALRRTPQRRISTLRLVGFVAASHALGGVLLAAHVDDTGEGIPLALLQGNVEQKLKNRDEVAREEILDRYLALTEVAQRAGASMAIWPEAAWPGRLNADLQRLPELKGVGLPLLMGASAYEWKNQQVRASNSAFWIRPGGLTGARYDKQHLVPFGEYVPLRVILPVEKLVPGAVDFSAGVSAAPIGSPKIGVLICYDGIFPEIARAEVDAGAEILANLTNDGWYGVSSAPYQHRDFYVLRAVETDRWVARAANTGLSVFVSPTGELDGQTALASQAMVVRRLWPRQTHTTYVVFGDWLPAIAIGTVLGALVLALSRHRRGLAHAD